MLKSLRGTVTGSGGQPRQGRGCQPCQSTFNGMVLTPTEFRYNLVLCFGYPPAGLTPLCDICGEAFTVSQAMTCKKDGLVHQRHDVYAREFGCFCEAGLTPSMVRKRPIIKNGCAPTKGEASNADAATELQKGVLAFSFWERRKTVVFDVRIIDMNQQPYLGRERQRLCLQRTRPQKV